MAKFEGAVTGDVDEVLAHVDTGIRAASQTVTLEEASDIDTGLTRVRIRAYERYSMTGGNRVSLTVVLVGFDGTVAVSAIATGGSTATFFKFNTLGEAAFLDTAVAAVRSWQPPGA